MAQVTEPEQLEASSMAQVTEAEQYQVFINHRGPDTKKNVASLIYKALVGYGLSVFLDKEELCKGDTLSPAIRGAISSSSVYIAIFSKNYAQSPWCLNELCWMLKSSHERRFIPIFYDVEPTDLRYIEKGCYAQAFDKHQRKGRVSMEVVEGWKKALGEAADIIGLTFKTKKSDYGKFLWILNQPFSNNDRLQIISVYSDYGKFLKEIEDIVIKQVKRDPLEVAAHPVGLDQASKYLQHRIQDRIQNGISTSVVVIAGLGGIGKSTLARRIFNDLSRPVSGQPKFSRASYLCNVRETVINDPTSLQRRLHRDLLGKDRDIPTTNEGNTMLQKSLRGLKFLIVFDDVDNGEKIRSVLDTDAVGPDSLIFITSRDKDILVTKKKTEAFVYHVPLLKNNDARELFCYHAFPQVAEGYADLVSKFLKFCDGLPLLLEVLGQQLADRPNREYWEERLTSFLKEGMPPSVEDSVIKKLDWSAHDMIYKQKEMFLDVAFFLVGEEEELAVRVLEGFDEYGKDASDHLKNLGKKCLVSFKNDVECHDEIRNQGQDIAIPEGKHLILPAVLPKRRTKIIMHNLLRALAPYIFSKEPPSQYNPLRLSCSNDIEKMLQSQSGSVKIRGICFRKDRTSPQLPHNINITDVRLLVVEHPIDASWFLGSGISGNLVWLRWRNSRFTSLPRTISLKSLRVLELQSPKDDLLEEFFDSFDEIPSELRVFSVDAREEGTSSSTSREEGISSGTWSSAQLVDLQHSTKSFDGDISTTLQNVMPSVFRFLQSIGSFMKNLNKIVLKNFTVPQSFPFDCSELKNLRHLDLSGSTNLTTLPNSFSQLLQLQHLALRDCINLSIPMHILGQITTLEHIDFKGCAQLVQLPEGISSQRSLRYLNLLETRLTELALEPLGKLEQLRIGSPVLTELRDSVAHFVNLKELILVGCVDLRHISAPIEQLACLERLEIYGSQVSILPSGIALLKHLKVLTICRCPIESFSFDNNVMDALTDLTLFDTSISNISIPAGACPRLDIVDLSYNLLLHEVQIFESTIVKLNLDGCSRLVYLKVLQLKFLSINGCGRVKTVAVQNWRSLEELMAERCLNLRIGKNVWTQLEGLKFFSFSKTFPCNAGKQNRRMEEAQYKKTFELFMKSTFQMQMRKMSFLTTNAFYNSSWPVGWGSEMTHDDCPYLMCFLTMDKGQLTECNDFMVRFVSTTAILRESSVRDNETGWDHRFGNKDIAIDYCKKIMEHGMETMK